LDVFGDFGGVSEVLSALAALALGPIASHAFLSKAISKLYIAKSKDESIFRQKKSAKSQSRKEKQENLKQNLSAKDREKLERLRQIKISYLQSAQAFLLSMWTCCSV
jgi:hypothetical protein